MSKSAKPVLDVSGAPRAFFGRRAGKPLHAAQKARLEARLPELEIALGDDRLDLKRLFPNARGAMLEIGFGGGEHLARQAAENPEKGFIGCEVFANGIAKIIERIEAGHLTNIRLYTDDALKLLDALPDTSLDAVYLLYPDPWPKTKHHKRRFVSALSLEKLARVIRPGGIFRVATDIVDYADWTLAHILRSPAFDWPVVAPGSWHAPFPGWQPTRYEQKARRQGRATSFYFEFVRR